MMRARHVLAAAALPCALVLAGCGSDSDTAATSNAPATSAAEAPETEAPAPSSTLEPEATSEAPASEDATETSEAPSTTSSAAGSSASESATGGEGEPAPKGAAIKEDPDDRFPDNVGSWTLSPASDSELPLYDNSDGGQIGVSFQEGADHPGMAELLTADRAPAGTGVCGRREAGNENLVCYLKVQNGNLTITGSTIDDITMKDMAGFANDITKVLGVTR